GETNASPVRFTSSRAMLQRQAAVRGGNGPVMSGALKYVGLDVGGTTMKAAVVDDDGRGGPAVSQPTEPERGQDAGLATMCATIRRAVAAAQLGVDDIAAIGVATPGTMDLKTGFILDPPNLKPWHHVPVRD